MKRYIQNWSSIVEDPEGDLTKFADVEPLIVALREVLSAPTMVDMLDIASEALERLGDLTPAISPPIVQNAVPTPDTDTDK
jgi:hypothetical protein